MKTFGITGGIGMGKSTAAGILADWGVAVTDTDVIARAIVEPGQPVLAEVKARFGSAILDDTGRLRRDELARHVFADAASRRDLEAILHPRIRALWLRQVEQWRKERRPIGAVIIPLLFETGAQEHFDATVCVACSSVTQRRRLVERGWTDEQIQQRIQAQWPTERKMERSDYVVWTEGTLETHAEQLKRIVG